MAGGEASGPRGRSSALGLIRNRLHERRDRSLIVSNGPGEGREEKAKACSAGGEAEFQV